MAEVPPFFVPFNEPAAFEAAYAEYARLCRRLLPPLCERVFSISFIHESEEWTATVGQRLTGAPVPGPPSRRSRGRRTRLTDPATVVAIFPPSPFLVLTNQRLPDLLRSAWESPFLAGSITAVTLFSPQP